MLTKPALAVLTSLAAAAVFSPTLRFPFLPWDDQRNLSVLPGFRGESSSDLSWIWTARVMGHWVPLTWASFAMDWALWGRDPAGYHGTNVVLHALNAALVYLVARRLLCAAGVQSRGALDVGALVAALAFALHPLRAESVAWVTERRDVLSGAAFLLAVLAYLRALRHEERTSPAWLGLSLLAFAGALLAKQSTIMLPAVLLVLDVYPLRRGAWRRALWEKVPFLGLAGAGTAVLAASMARDVGFTPLTSLGIGDRAAQLAYALVYYPLQTAVPFGVSPLHEMPARLELLSPRVLPSVVIAIAVTALALLTRQRAPWLLAAWVYGAIAILPVSGVLHAPGTNLVSDRYSYLGTLGWAVLLGGAAAAALARARRRSGRALVLAAFAIVLTGWTALTWREVQIWRDGESLWRAAVAKDPACATCRGYLAAELLSRGQAVEATEQAALAVRLRPDLPVPLSILGYTRHALRDVEGAAHAFAAAAQLDGRYEARARAALGAALRGRGRFSEAVGHLRASRVLEPSRETDAELARALHALGLEEARAGRPAEAARHLEEALALHPESAEIREALLALRRSPK